MATMNGKVCLVTGATQGIGKETARALVKIGADVTIVGRNPERTAAAADELAKERGGAKVDFLLGDLSSMADVRKVASDFRAKHDRLDVLVNNAGVIIMDRTVTKDGYEATFATNHLAYFLLTELLLDLLKKSAPSRIVNVSSAVHTGGKIPFDDLNGEKSYSGTAAYSQSKLANVLFTYELARRLEGTGVTANALHPGVIRSGFGRNNGGWLGFGVKLMAPFLITPEKGARTTVYLASSPDVEGVTGKYFDKCKPVPSSKLSHDESVAKQLWSVSEEMVKSAGAAS